VVSSENCPNFGELYQPLADSWQVIDHSVVDKPRGTAAGQRVQQRALGLDPAAAVRRAMKRVESEREDDEFLAEVEAVEAAVQQAVKEALRMHKLAGNPVAEWKDGRVVWVPAEQIDVEDESTDAPETSAG
jgi:hypothetical protein